MFKRIFITFLTIQFLLFGSSSAWAQSTDVPSEEETEEADVSSQEETQETDVSVEQSQSVSTDGTADDITQEQDIIVEQSQDQSTPHEEESNELEEGAEKEESDSQPAEEQLVEGEKISENNVPSEEESNEAIDETGTDSEMEEDQTDEQKESVEHSIEESEHDDSYRHEQNIEVIAEQKQIVTGADQVEGIQEQDVTVEYSQSLKVSQNDSQNQSAAIKTDQDQSFITENQTDYVEQRLVADIKTKQEGEINPVEGQNTTKQEASITTTGHHESITVGEAVIEQQQTVEADVINTDTKSESLSLKAKAANGLEIMNNVAQTVVKIFQSIVVNDETVEEFEKEMVVDQNKIDQKQEYSKTYDWGTLHVINHVVVQKQENQDLYSLLDSIIRLDYSLPKLPPDNHEDDNDSHEDNDDNDSDDDYDSSEQDRDYNGDGSLDNFEGQNYYTNPMMMNHYLTIVNMFVLLEYFFI